MSIKRYYGAIESQPDARDKDYQFYLSAEYQAAIPPTGSVKDLFPPVYDQGQLNSCAAWANKGLMAAAYTKQGMTEPDLSALMLYWMGLKAMGAFTDTGCCPRDVLKAAANTGVASEAIWPYDIKKFAVEPSAESFLDAEHHKILSYHAMLPTMGLLRGCIASGYPFSVGIPIHENFPEGEGIKDIPMPAGEKIGGHDTVIVAYDDYARLFLLRNSWTNLWGIDGYATIPYDYIYNYSWDQWTIRLMDPDNPSMPVAPANKEGCLVALLRMIAGK